MRSSGSSFDSLRNGWHSLISRYLVVSSVPLLSAQVITGVLGLTRNVLLTNALAKEDYGGFNYLLSWLPVVSLLGLPGLNAAIAQYAARGHWEVVRLGLRRRLPVALLPMAALAAFGWMGRRTGQSDIMPSLWFLTALFFPTAQVLGLVGSILGALKRFRHLAAYYVGQSSAFLLATAMGLWLWPGPATTGIVLFQWLLLSVLNGCFWARLRRPETEPVPLSPAQRSQFYRFGTHMTALAAIGQAQARIGALLLGSVVSLYSLADYAVGDLFFAQMKGLWTVYQGVSYPRLLNLKAADRWKQVRREAWLATPALAALAAIVGIALSFLVPLLFSDKYTSSLPYIWVLLFAFACSIPGGFFEMYFRSEESEGALYRIRLLSSLVGVLLPPLLLWLWGPLGVPAARAGASLVYSLVGFALFRCQR